MGCIKKWFYNKTNGNIWQSAIDYGCASDVIEIEEPVIVPIKPKLVSLAAVKPKIGMFVMYREDKDTEKVIDMVGQDYVVVRPQNGDVHLIYEELYPGYNVILDK